MSKTSTHDGVRPSRTLFVPHSPPDHRECVRISWRTTCVARVPHAPPVHLRERPCGTRLEHTSMHTQSHSGSTGERGYAYRMGGSVQVHAIWCAAALGAAALGATRFGAASTK